MREDFDRVHVLIVDEDSLVRWFVSEVAQEAGCIVREAARCEEALTLARRLDSVIDIAFIDCPRTHADLRLASVFTRLRPAARVVLMTSAVSEGFESHARDAGIAHVLMKPFSVDDVRAVLRRRPAQPGHAADPLFVPFRLRTPRALRRHQERTLSRLREAADDSASVRVAAKHVSKLLRSHASREDHMAFPPLGALPLLAEGIAWPEMRAAVDMAAALAGELPAMLEEHEAILSALEGLREAAARAGRRDLANVAQQLKEHTELEAEVLYPAAVITGKFLETQLSQERRS